MLAGEGRLPILGSLQIPSSALPMGSRFQSAVMVVPGKSWEPRGHLPHLGTTAYSLEALA